MKKILIGLASRLREPSSYAGLAAGFGLLGVNVDPGLLQNIVATLAGIAAVVSFFLPDPGKITVAPLPPVKE